MENLTDDSKTRAEIVDKLDKVVLVETASGQVVIGHNFRLGLESNGEYTLQDPVGIVVKGKDYYFQFPLGRPKFIVFSTKPISYYNVEIKEFVRGYIATVNNTRIIKMPPTKLMQ